MTTEKEVIAVLKEIIDPHSNISVYDMGLISELKITDSTVSLTFRPTSQFCPLGAQLAHNIKRRIRELKGAKNVKVKVIGHVHEKMINESLTSA
jgi:metal-sulfur cluster biosynthetic enzyme